MKTQWDFKEFFASDNDFLEALTIYQKNAEKLNESFQNIKMDIYIIKTIQKMIVFMHHI